MPDFQSNLHFPKSFHLYRTFPKAFAFIERLYRSIRPQIGRFVRVVGRPRLDWTNLLLKEGSFLIGHEKFERLLTDGTEGAQQRWIAELRRIFG